MVDKKIGHHLSYCRFLIRSRRRGAAAVAAAVGAEANPAAPRSWLQLGGRRKGALPLPWRPFHRSPHGGRQGAVGEAPAVGVAEALKASSHAAGFRPRVR